MSGYELTNLRTEHPCLSSSLNLPSQADESIRSAPIYRVVLTGGPCSGKTSSLVVLKERFEHLGWKVFVVPEAATTLMNGGISFPELSEEGKFLFQVRIIKTMFHLEETFYEIAKLSGVKTIILCDRGSMDGSAYIDEACWNRILTENGWNTVMIRDSRYDCVIHLTTAANGAREFYTLENNTIRKETVEQAIWVDERVKNCWLGHPYLYMIDNSTAFQPKIDRVFQAVCKFIGLDVDIEKRKYLVTSCPDVFPVSFTDSIVEHHYITTTDGSQARLRKRGIGNDFDYTLTIRYVVNDGQKAQVRRKINSREYLSLLSLHDPSTKSILKKRRTFVINNISYELDFYQKPCSDLMMLEAYVPRNSTLSVPDFLGISGNVTNDPKYSMYTIAISK